MLATLASAAMLILVGKVVDHAPVATVAAGVCAGLALVALGLSLASSIWTLGFALFGLRLFGQGLMTHTAMTAMGRWYEKERGRAVSIAGLGHQIGEGVLPLVVVGLLSWLAWTTVWQGAAFIMLTIALPVIFLLMRVERLPRGKATQDTVYSQRQYTRSEALADPLFWVLCVTTLAPAFIGTSFFFHQQHVGEVKQWSQALIAASFGAMAIANIVFALLAGILIDRFSAKTLLPFYFIPLACACTVMSVFEAPATLWVFMILLGASGGTANTLLGAVWPEIYGTKHLGSIRSLIMAGMVFSSALGPGVTGWFIDRGVSFPTQTLYMVVFCTISTVVLYFTSKALRARA